MTSGGETENNWPPFTPSAATHRTRGRGLHGLLLQHGVCVCPLPYQRHWSGGRFSCWNQKLLGQKMYPQGSSEVRCCLFNISSPKSVLILEGNNIELVSYSAALIQQPQQLKTRTSGNLWMVSLFLTKEQFSRLMKKSKLPCYRNSKTPNDSSDLFVIF